MSTLFDYHKLNKTKYMEGFTQEVPLQCESLKKIMNENRITQAMEIGFNAGHSADLFLKNNNNLQLVSFDLGQHKSVQTGKTYIDANYPNRHTLILGNSLVTIPEFIKKNDVKFDLIFIDGGHDYNVAINDLYNCKNLAHSNTIVIMDDTVIKKESVRFYNIGPMKAWSEAKSKNIVHELGSEEYEYGRGQSWGKYIIN